MKNKTLSLFALSVFALVLLVSSVSALTLTTVPTTLPVFTEDGQLESITINSVTTFDVTMPTSPFFNVINTTLISGVTTATFNITSVDSETLPVGPNTLTINVAETGNATNTGSFAVTFVNSFCKYEPQNFSDLKLKVDVNNVHGDDEEIWNPLDTVRVEVDFENNFDSDGEDTYDLDDVILQLGLVNTDGKDVAGDFEWVSKDSEEVDVGNIDEDEKTTHIFEFKVDPSEIESGDYVLVVKAYEDGKETTTCIDYSDDFGSGSERYYMDITVEEENDVDKSVVVDVNALEQPILARCGEKVALTVDVWNIGGDDFADQIMVNLFNTALGLNVKNVVDGDFDSGDHAKVTFTFDVPRNADEKTYPLGFRTYYDYDEDDDDYKEMSDDVFEVKLNVAGSCVYATADTTEVTPNEEFVSGGKAGQPLVVEVTVKNTGDKTVTYTFNLAGYSAWAELGEIAPANVTLAPGESKEVLVTLNVNKDAKGENTFDFETYSNGQLVTKQPLSAPITGGFSLGSITGGVVSESATPLIIGLVSVILVVVIVIVIVKITKKP